MTQTVYDTVAHGAQIQVAQSTTHNFSGTTEPLQQMNINRVRAAELRREFIASTLNGYSGFIDARGRLYEPPGNTRLRTVSTLSQSGTTSHLRFTWRHCWALLSFWVVWQQEESVFTWAAAPA